jgi:two-component system phosphate regulon response regulator PhoB
MKSILLADDEESLRILVYATLDYPDYEIVEASDGDEAIELARRHHPDLMVLDWMMPGKTGVEVTAELRRESATRDTPIILLTAKNQQDDMSAAFETGVTSYLVKPFSPAELLGKVREFLGEGKA